MSVLDVVKRGVSGLATVAGKGFEGYGQDQQIDNARVMAALKSAREGENDRVTNLVKQKELARMQPGDQGYGAYKADEIRATGPAETEQAINTASGLAPIHTQEAVNTAKGVAPVSLGTHESERRFDNANPAPVPQSFTPVTLAGENGSPPVVKPFNTKTGAVGPSVGDAKPAVGATPAASNPQMAAAKANFQSALKTMDDFEAKLRAGTATYTPGDATKGALGSSEKTQNASGVLGGIESLVGNYAGASLRGDNAELANYLKAKKFLAEAALNTHKRPNQTQYEIEQELSGVGSRLDGFQSPEAAGQIAQSKDRRDRFASEVFGIGGPPVAGPAAGRSSPVAGTPAPIGSREAAVAHLKAQGKSDAQILQILGPP